MSFIVFVLGILGSLFLGTRLSMCGDSLCNRVDTAFRRSTLLLRKTCEVCQLPLFGILRLLGGTDDTFFWGLLFGLLLFP
jgi:hypothetical protein